MHREPSDLPSFESISDGYMVLDRGWSIRKINDAAVQELGVRRENVIGRSIWEVFPGAEGSVIEHQYRAAMSTGRPARFESRLGPRERRFSIVAYPSPNGLQILFHDVTDRAERDETLRRNERYLREMVEGLPTGAMLVGQDGSLQMNRMAEAITGRSRYEVTDLDSFFRLVGGWRAAGLRQAYHRAKAGGFGTVVPLKLTRQDGTVCHVEFAAYRGELGEVCILHDVTARVEAQRELRRAHRQVRLIANRDGLTGLLNRGALDRQLATEEMRCRAAGQPLALLMIDVDRFKAFNDKFGHPEGDVVLRRLADILEGSVRPGDSVGRFGGEEFAVVLPGTDLALAEVVAERIRSRVEAEPWTVAPVTVSVGISALQGRALRVEDLVSAADRALYESKRLGRNRVTCQPVVV